MAKVIHFRTSQRPHFHCINLININITFTFIFNRKMNKMRMLIEDLNTLWEFSYSITSYTWSIYDCMKYLWYSVGNMNSFKQELKYFNKLIYMLIGNAWILSIMVRLDLMLWIAQKCIQSCQGFSFKGGLTAHLHKLGLVKWIFQMAVYGHWYRYRSHQC